MTTRTLAVISDNDTQLPSAQEGPRLKRAMRSCTLETLEGASHAAMNEAGVDLTVILRRTGFLPRWGDCANPFEPILESDGLSFVGSTVRRSARRSH
jgi:hypothetical protein